MVAHASQETRRLRSASERRKPSEYKYSARAFELWKFLDDSFPLAATQGEGSRISATDGMAPWLDAAAASELSPHRGRLRIIRQRIAGVDGVICRQRPTRDVVSSHRGNGHEHLRRHVTTSPSPSACKARHSRNCPYDNDRVGGGSGRVQSPVAATEEALARRVIVSDEVGLFEVIVRNELKERRALVRQPDARRHTYSTGEVNVVLSTLEHLGPWLSWLAADRRR